MAECFLLVFENGGFESIKSDLHFALPNRHDNPTLITAYQYLLDNGLVPKI